MAQMLWGRNSCIGGRCFGEVGHGAKPATGCTVIQKSTDARRRGSFANMISSAPRFSVWFKDGKTQGKGKITNPTN